MLASKFIEAELNAYIQEQRLTYSPLMVTLICKAFEAYDKYKRLVSIPNFSSEPSSNIGDDICIVKEPTITNSTIRICKCSTKDDV